jgi:transposase
VRDFLREGVTKRIYLAQLPGYAPEPNPDEAVWNYLKCVELKKFCCHNLNELKLEIRKAIARLRHKTEIIQNFIRHVYPNIELSFSCPDQ